MDNYIQAEFLNSKLNPDGHLTELIEKLMMHKLYREQNPSSPCMKPNKYDGSVCFKHYPKSLQSEIIVHENSYPLYCHRADEHKVMKWINEVKVIMGNKWVVLYSPFLLYKYQTHINVEMIEIVQMCKYIHKYIYKREDCVIICFKRIYIDEVAKHLNEYYIGPMQTAYQMLEYPFHKEDSLITVLSIHFPNKQSVYFSENATVKEIQQIAD